VTMDGDGGGYGGFAVVTTAAFVVPANVGTGVVAPSKSKATTRRVRHVPRPR